MKLLLATTQTQGSIPGDFAWVDEGELVTPGRYGMCDSHRLAGEGLSRCGCDRSFNGIVTGKGITTARVEESTLTREDVIGLMVNHLTPGWGAYLSAKKLLALATEEVDAVLAFTENHEAGTIARMNVRDIFAA